MSYLNNNVRNAVLMYVMFIFLDISASPEPQPGASTSTKCDNGTDLLKKYFFKDEVTSSELLWTLQTVASHNSHRKAGEQASLFPLMFPDSDIAAKF